MIAWLRSLLGGKKINHGKDERIAMYEKRNTELANRRKQALAILDAATRLMEDKKR